MRNTILALVALFLVAGLGTRSMLSQDAPLPARLGFVDLGKVFTEYRKRADIEARLKLEDERLNQHYKKLSAELEEAKDALRIMNPGSEAFVAKERELQMKAYAVKFDRERDGEALERVARREKAALYREINGEVAAYGEDHGFAAILLSTQVDEQLERRADMDLVTSTRTVLWHDERLDVTDEVIQILNASLPPAEEPK